MAHSYDTYFDWTIGAPIVFAVVVFFILIVLYIAYCCSGSLFLRSILFSFVKSLAFDKGLEEGSGEDSEESSSEASSSENEKCCSRKKATIPWILYKQDLLVLEVWNMIFVAYISVCCVFISFWATFLVEETHICDRSLDCFVTNSSTLKFESAPREPIQDCSLVDNNDTIVCFEFVFDVTGGLASAFGFLTFLIAYIHIVSSITIGLVKEVQYGDVDKQLCLMCGISCFPTILMIVTVAVIVVIVKVPIFSNAAFMTAESTLVFVSYTICFLYVGPLSSSVIIVVGRHHSRLRYSSTPANARNGSLNTDIVVV